MKMIMLSKASNDLLSARLSAYVDAVNVTLAALGLDGDWKYDPQMGAMVHEELSAEPGITSVCDESPSDLDSTSANS
jgi:hypothetical protein